MSIPLPLPQGPTDHVSNKIPPAEVYPHALRLEEIEEIQANRALLEDVVASAGPPRSQLRSPLFSQLRSRLAGRPAAQPAAKASRLPRTTRRASSTRACSASRSDRILRFLGLSLCDLLGHWQEIRKTSVRLETLAFVHC